MPFVIDRRGFLRTAGAALLAPLGIQAADAPLRLALFSDTHIAADPQDQNRGFFPHQNLKRAVSQAVTSNYGLLLVNGDLARREGLPEDYVQWNALMQPLLERGPVAVTLGNHDDRKNARSALTNRAGDIQPVEQKLVTILEAGNFRLLFLDSLMLTNISPGQLGHAQRQWLAGQVKLQSASKPVIVFVHHNPDPDNDGALVDAEQLLAILRPNRAVKAIIFGHTHRYLFDKVDGLHLINLPAIGYNFEDGVPVGWVSTELTPEGGDFRLHALGGDPTADNRLTSLHWR